MPEENLSSLKKAGNSIINLMKVLFTIAIVIVFGYFWLFAVVGILFYTTHRLFYFIVMNMLSIGLFGLFIYAVEKQKKKALLRVSCGLVAVSLVVGGGFRAYTWWTVDRFPVMKQEVNWRDYTPFREGNRLVKVEIPAEYSLVFSGERGQEDYKNELPRLNGAYALYPIYAAMAQGMYPASLFQDYRYHDYLDTDGSDVIYEELLKGGRDLIFALAPSKKQSEEAEAAGVEYELTPFCMDAFVFFVNAENPVDNLTTEQIRGIYSGKITDWKEVGVPKSTKIIPFQRNEGSGSQTTLQKFMGDTPIMPPLKEDRLGGMGDIINDTANYRNYRAALGFSFRYYSTEMLRNNQIKLLSVDGVAPTVENIHGGTYPLVTTVYMVTKGPRSANVRKIVDYMLSPEGQKLVEDTGYVPIRAASESAP